jgi:drug/metabolite transporter (DMT)-like permease
VTARQLDRTAPDRQFRTGLLFAIASAFTFGTSGPLGKSLMEAGWSPTAAVTARLAAGAVLMAVFATIVKRDWIRESLRHAKTVVAYGVAPIAGAQLCFYNAVSHLSVAVALLIEYTAPLLVVGWLWASTRQRPGNLVLGGIALAIVGVMLVLDVFTGARVNVVGVCWALGAALCAACYFLMSDRVAAADGDHSAINPVTLAAGGLAVGAVAVGLLGMVGVQPMTFHDGPVTLAGFSTPWIVPVVLIALVPTAIAYTLGILGIARLRPRFASLVGMAEVLFAVLIAWAMLGEAISVTQAVGGAVVLVGLALARQGDRTDKVAQASFPEAPAQPPNVEQSIRRT